MEGYYTRHSVVDFEEDLTHEFKAHTNLCVEEVPPGSWLPHTGRRSRAPVSRCLNGFLNTGLGGIVYLGITDMGDVRGIPLTQYMKDHLNASLSDLMERYTPPVDPHRYRIRFVPVVDANLSQQEISKIIAFGSSGHCNEARRKKPHTMRKYMYCWCHKDAVAQTNNGVMPQDYVVEITIKPWDCNDPRNTSAIGEMRAHPIHQDEQYKAHFRGHATLTQYSVQEIHQAAVNEVQQHYGPQLDSLKAELRELRSQLFKHKR